MSALLRSCRDFMDIYIQQTPTETRVEINIAQAALFPRFPQRRCGGVTLHGLAVATQLQPAIEFSVEGQQESVFGVENER